MWSGSEFDGRWRCGVAEEDEGVGAGGGVGFEVEAEGAAGGSLGEAGDEGALLGRDVGAAVGEQHLDLFDGQGAEADGGAAGADGGQEFAGVFGEDEDVDGGGRLLEDFEQGVGGLLHHVGGGEDEDAAGGFGGQVVGALDEGADLAELDEELRRVGREDEDVGVGLDEDAGVLLVGLAEFFAGGDGGGDLLFEVGGGGDAGAVGQTPQKPARVWPLDQRVAGLALALDGHGEHEGEGVFAGSGGAGEDEGVGQAAGGDGGAEVIRRRGCCRGIR